MDDFDSKQLLAAVKTALSGREGDDAAALLIDEAVTGLRRSRDKILSESKVYRDKLRSFEGLDPENMRQVIEAARRQGEEKYQSEIEKLREELAEEQAAISQLIVENGLTDALVRAGVTEAGLKFAKAFFLPRVQIRTEGEKRTAMIGDKDLSAAVADWTKTDEAKLFLRASASTGGGAIGNAGGSSSAKAMARAQFETLDPGSRMSFVRAGGQISDS